MLTYISISVLLSFSFIAYIVHHLLYFHQCIPLDKIHAAYTTLRQKPDYYTYMSGEVYHQTPEIQRHSFPSLQPPPPEEQEKIVQYSRRIEVIVRHEVVVAKNERFL
jgi:hypothetical protein